VNNQLAWTRLKDRVDPEGNKVLFVEEIQSDWHQQGRERGYVPRNAEHVNDRHEYLSAKALHENLSEEEAAELLLLRQQAELSETGRHLRAPDAPFRNTWHEFVLKRLIRLAAQGGYYSIAWTTGDQQNERYHLSKSQMNCGGNKLLIWKMIETERADFFRV
jgi:hypothetical protein